MRVAVMACEPYSVSAAAHHHGAAHRWRLVSTAIAASMAPLKGNLLPCDYGCARYLCGPQQENRQRGSLLVSYMPLALSARPFGFWVFPLEL